MFKSVGELLEQSFGRGNSAAWVRAETYALMVGVLVLSTIQLMSLNRGLAMWKAGSWARLCPAWHSRRCTHAGCHAAKMSSSPALCDSTACPCSLVPTPVRLPFTPPLQ